MPKFKITGKILSEVFKTSTMIHDSSWKTKYQFIHTKYTTTLIIFRKSKVSRI